jgi:tRNA (cmo5U34)-methyltransferase
VIDIPQSWTFNTASVADDFDAHVREQLPWYDLVTGAIVQIARHYISEGGHVYDIGASTGNIGRALTPVLFQRKATLTAIESAPEMAERYNGPGELVVCRAEEHDFGPFDFGVAMLALMFVPPADVAPLLDRLVDKIRPGGALLIVERTLPPAGYLSIVTSRLTLAAKAAMGAPADQIVAKELSLAGVQRPLDVGLLTTRGAVEWFRFGDFAGYLIEGAA